MRRAVIVLLLAAAPAWAQEPPKPPAPAGGDAPRGSAPRAGEAPTAELKNVGGLFLAAESATAAALLFLPDLIPEPGGCRWCSPPGFDLALNGALRSRNPRRAATISHVFSGAVTPAISFAGVIVPALLPGERRVHALQDSVIILSSVVTNTAITAAVKSVAARRRPAFFFEREAETEFSGKDFEENASFFSGDTSIAFSAAASAATLAFLRGYKTAPLIAGAGGAAALAAGVYRVAADAHWPTDVLAGAAAGTLVGAAVPLLLHGRAPAAAPLSSSPGVSLVVPLAGFSW
jgi:membrane-associated phospholipid phosphatase